MVMQDEKWADAKVMTENPGRFEGEKPWVVLAHEDAMNGFFQFHHMVLLTDSVRRGYRLDDDIVAFLITIDEQGFVLGATYTLADLVESVNRDDCHQRPLGTATGYVRACLSRFRQFDTSR